MLVRVVRVVVVRVYGGEGGNLYHIGQGSNRRDATLDVNICGSLLVIELVKKMSINMKEKTLQNKSVLSDA